MKPLQVIALVVSSMALGMALTSLMHFKARTQKPKVLIEQDVRACETASKFQVFTYLWYYGDIIYSGQTWLHDYKCLELEQVDSAKKAEYKMAEEFLINYKKLPK